MNLTVAYQQNRVAKNTLSIVLVGPDERRRRALAQGLERQQTTITNELAAYPALDDLVKLLRSDCDVVAVDLDGDPDVALDLVEAICGQDPAITVIVYSRRQDPEMLVRCMRAGAREFLAEPVLPQTLAEAVVRASARRLDPEAQKRVAGKILMFWGAKGGSGVTTLATNFAIALKNESGKDVAIVDMHLHLGDVAVSLGVEPRFNLLDALKNQERLDGDFVSTLLTEHRTGVKILAAPDEYAPEFAPHSGGLGKLLQVLRGQFSFVVVDAGPGLGAASGLVLDMSDAVYLVTQAEIPALRNAHRLIGFLHGGAGSSRRLDVILNRFDPRRTDLETTRIEKALGAPLKWKVPNDFSRVRRSVDTGSPLALESSPVSKILYQMAREACGKPAPPPDAKWKGLFR